MSFFAELFEFLKTRKKLWIFPLVVVFVLIGFLLVAINGSVVAPFIYPLF